MSEAEKKECNLLLQNQEKMLLERQLVLLEALARSMCHEFNNVLGGILGYGQLALRSPGDANIAERALNVAVRGARRGSELVSRMSQFAHYQVDTPWEVDDPIRLVQDCVEILRPEMEHNQIAIDCECSVTPAIRHQPPQLRLCILELLQNAMDALKDAEVTEKRIRVVLTALENGSVQLRINDNGIGISEELQRRITEPFFSSRDVLSGGTSAHPRGLGLAIVKRVVQEHGGTLTIESTREEGTSAIIDIPFCEECVRDRRRILTIDDEAVMRKIYNRFLSRDGYESIDCASAACGLERLEKEEFDLILLDHMMPGMSGLEFLQELQRRESNVPVIMITAAYNTEIARKAMEFGAREVMAKPINRAKLLFLVSKFLRGKGLKEAVTSARSAGAYPSERILIIDSDPLTLEVITLCLERAGYGTQAVDGLEKARAATREEYFDLILMDPMLHDGNPTEAVWQLRVNNPYTPVVLLTGQSRLPLIREVMDAGAAHAIAKPVDVLNLLSDVQAILDVFREEQR